ncbi:MAG: transcriptional regulator [Clostridium sp.]|nr:transcriptional regulator [Clostridium sp.]
MRVGIIGPLDSSKKINSDLKKIDPELETNLYVRENVSSAIDVIESCEKECDAIMFTGCGVYECVKNIYDIKKPHVFISRGGTSMIKAFWEVKRDNIDLNRFSIDVVENSIIDDLLCEIDVNPKNVYSLPFSSHRTEMDYVNWHIKLFEENKIDVIFTGFGAVYSELKKRGYPAFRLQATISQVRASYEQLKTEFALTKAQYSQIAVEILNIQDEKATKENYYSNMIKQSECYKTIVEYVRNIQGSLFTFGRNEYVIFAHKGAIDNNLNYSQLIELHKNIKNLGLTIKVGIGIGVTAYQAEANAYKCLNRHVDSNDFHLFLIDENDIIKGPLGSLNEINYSIASSDKNTMDISDATGLSCESISKLIAISNTRKNNIYSSKDLADNLNISERSARRILNKLITSNYGRIYAKETSTGGGRPKNLVELLF